MDEQRAKFGGLESKHDVFAAYATQTTVVSYVRRETEPEPAGDWAARDEDVQYRIRTERRYTISDDHGEHQHGAVQHDHVSCPTELYRSNRRRQTLGLGR